MGIEELPGVIANDIQDAIESDSQSVAKEMHEDEIALEKLRIKTEERIMERQAERDENVAEMQTGMDEMRSMFNSLLNRFDAFMNTLPASTPVIHTEVNPSDDEDDENDENENEDVPTVASEDIVPEENPEVLSAADNIEAEVEHPVDAVENTEEEIVNGNKSSKRSRKRRGRR